LNECILKKNLNKSTVKYFYKLHIYSLTDKWITEIRVRYYNFFYSYSYSQPLPMLCWLIITFSSSMKNHVNDVGSV